MPKLPDGPMITAETSRRSAASIGVASGIGFRNYVANSIEQHKSLGNGAFYDPIY